ncbi:hypothetical protein WA577_001767 [Blastocystis sp. JDR]
MSRQNGNEMQYYDFPPFFTLQPNPDTREKQIQTWIKYIMEYCKSNGLSEVNVNSFPLFENRSIERSLDPEMRIRLMNELCEQGYGHKENDSTYSIIEKSVKDWAYTIYNWMIENGYRMEVMDLEEIRAGDRVCHEAFYNMKESLFGDCIEVLRRDGKVGPRDLDDE